MTEAPGDDMILYVRKSHFAYPDDGSFKEFNELRNEFLENVTHKNELIKGYYPNSHAWGPDRTEYVDAFILTSMEDLDNMFDRQGELFRAHWTDEEARKEYGKKSAKYWTGIHGDYIRRKPGIPYLIGHLDKHLGIFKCCFICFWSGFGFDKV